MADLDDELDAALMEDDEEEENEEELTQEDVDDEAGDSAGADPTGSAENTDEDNDLNDEGGDNDGDEDTGDEDNEPHDSADYTAKLKFIQTLPEPKAREHEQFRRSHFDKHVIRRCMTQVIEECSEKDARQPAVHNTLAIIMSGLAKRFVGELTERARELMDRNGEVGPIRPHHLREVHRKYYKRHPLARGRQRRRLLA
ncbi:unnamed protein product [Aphanomyces euteiches]|uniref:TAFII28-like protein domain-containing protein n=1 Tax=Aphanomyces euteiches TaxID=100861 RepID=A0A6G0XRQ7_9STRA|nr:hypothetical protein Ae201684_002090 [Aphanomyces euteiches]KAH9086691.1 hypothetical protein Ae201684P_000113 [Aphanomyces euteiches]KAH9132603.1 hypothetical protein AeRB84_021040 [Aphanomyces euteiches]KAH9145240.1 hypothetical protein AeRB84_010873 [Aphanomyces euteiches]KAH9147687.1 hypothetical protein AeRB84_008751 [Aphanomyces euteiches]